MTYHDDGPDNRNQGNANIGNANVSDNIDRQSDLLFSRTKVKYDTPPIVPDETDATHWVYVVNEDYNFFKESECAVLYSDFPYNDDTQLLALHHKTLVKVLEEGIGRNNEYYLVEVVGMNTEINGTVGVVSYKNIKDLFPSQSLPVSYAKCKTGPITVGAEVDDFPGITSREWQDTKAPFYNSRTCKYCVNVETVHSSTGGLQFPSYRQEALREGVNRLLIFYNKKLDDPERQRYLDNPMFAHAESWYMDPDKPNSNLKFLICISAKYFDAIPERNILPRDLEGESRGVARIVTFDSSEIVGQFSKIVRRFKSYENSREWKKFKYRYLGPVSQGYGIIDFRLESKYLELFLGSLRNILELNGHSLRKTHSDRIEIGLSEDFKVKYIFYDDGSGTVSLNKGIGLYKRVEPFNIARTCGYVFYMFDMIRDINKMTWKLVLKSYTYPKPDLKHSSNKCIEKFDNKLLCLDSDEKFDTFNKVRDPFRGLGKFSRPGKPRREFDPEEFLGAASDFTDKLSAAKAASLISRELADIEGIAVDLDAKMDVHFDRVSEDFASFLILKLRDFIDSFSFNQPNEKMIAEVNLVFADLIVKFPDFTKLLQISYQSTCLRLEMAREQLEQFGLLDENNDMVQMASMAQKLSCDDICEALPVVCSLDSINVPNFPPRIELPELPTIDIMSFFKIQLEKQLMSTIFKSVASMALNMLESFVAKADRFQFDDLDLKNNFTANLDVNLNSASMERALIESGVDINNVFDVPDVGLPGIADPEMYEPPPVPVPARGVPNRTPSFVSNIPESPVIEENIIAEPEEAEEERRRQQGVGDDMVEGSPFNL